MPAENHRVQPCETESVLNLCILVAHGCSKLQPSLCTLSTAISFSRDACSIVSESGRVKKESHDWKISSGICKGTDPDVLSSTICFSRPLRCTALSGSDACFPLYCTNRTSPAAKNSTVSFGLSSSADIARVSPLLHGTVWTVAPAEVALSSFDASATV
jgi:hypothetical protein